jgi:HNH endonuclease
MLTAWAQKRAHPTVRFLGVHMSDINQAERAFQTWPILTATAKRRETITYLQLGNAIGIHHRAVRFVLDLIQNYCIEEKLPPLTILVVNGSGHPGTGFIAYDLNHFDQGLEEVWSKDWKSVENPFDFATSGSSYGSLLKDLTTAPEESEAVYVKVKSRGIKQFLFRSALLHAYSRKCAFTGISILETLEACHIVPWSQGTPQQRMDVRNGLLLNSLHHRLFDGGYITISKSYEIIYYDPNGKDREHTAFERPFTTGLHMKVMSVPRLLKHRPLSEYIDRHHQIEGWEI